MQSSKYKIFSYTFWFLAAMFYLFQYVLRVSPGVITDDLMRDFHITATTIGSIMGVASAFYVLFQIPAGTITDAYGVRRPLTFALLLASLGVILFAKAPNLSTVYIARVLIGIGSAFAFICASKIISLYFTKERLPFMISLTIFIGSLGGVIGVGPLADAVYDYGWRTSLLQIGFIGLLLTALVFIIGRVQKRLERQTGDVVARTSLLEGLKYAVTNRDILVIALWGFCIYMPMCVYADSWGVPYMMKALSLTKPVAAEKVSWIYIGVLVGSLSYGWLATWYQNYRNIFFFSSLSLAILFYLALWQSQLVADYVTPLHFLIGVINSVQLLMFPAAARYAPVKMTGAVVGFVNTFAMVSGAIFQKCVGVGMDLLWEGSQCNDVPDYAIHCYQVPLTIVVIMMALATIMTLFMREQRNQ